MLKRALAAISLILVLSCDQNTPLIQYQPKSSQEQALKDVLLKFQEAVLNRDSDKVMDLIHPSASIMIGSDRKLLSKTEYAAVLPQRLAENSYIALGNPKMTVNGDKAQIKMFMTRAENNFLMIFQMKLENGKWTILSWEY